MSDTNIPIDHGESVDYTPEYKKYLKDKAEGKLDQYNGYVPFPFPRQKPLPIAAKRAFPSYFDPRSTYMTPVKSQGGNGVCWAFASIANLEALVSLKTGVKNDYSEEHLRFDVSDQNIAFWYSREADDSSNFTDVAASFTNWRGPVNESDAPYSPNRGGKWDDKKMSAPVQLHVTGAKYLFGRDDKYFEPANFANYVNSVKQAITDYGSVYVGLKWNRSVFLNETNNAYMSVEPSSVEYSYHSLLLCGWNDNFPSIYFNAPYRPKNNGAWLVKNSWGTTSFGDRGYFWISYEEPRFDDFETFTGFRPATNEKMLALDTNIMGSPRQYTVETYMCNIFDLTDAFQKSSSISDIMIFTGSIGSTYSIYVVPVPDGAPPEVPSLTTPVATGVHAYTGHTTVTLPTPYAIPGAGKYAFVVKTSVGNNGLSTCYNEYIHKERNGLNQYYKTRGESFIYSGSGWVDNYELTNERGELVGNWCIRPILQPNAVSVIEWKPKVRGSVAAGNITLGIARGLYYSVGAVKHIHAHVVIENISGNPTGNIEITGAPFPPIYETPLNLGITSMMSHDLDQRYIVPSIKTDGVIWFLSCGAGAERPINVNMLSNGTTLHLYGSFISKV